MAAGPRDPNVLALMAAEVGASKIAAPAGLAHSSRVASIDHSPAGRALIALSARRGWLSQTRLPAGSLIRILLSCGCWVLDLDFQVIRRRRLRPRRRPVCGPKTLENSPPAPAGARVEIHR